MLAAETGSGKTTQVPSIAERALGGGLVLVTQPRRLAARLVARRVAAERGEPLGRSIGLETRHERVVGPDPRIVFLTEGLLVRRLAQQPVLPGVRAVVLDEFHERTIDADLLLALLRRLQDGARPDLRLVVMSATLDLERLAAALGTTPLVVEGRTHPVSVAHARRHDARPPWDRAAESVRALADETDGHLLVFMPGAGEINRTIRAIERAGGARGRPVRPLHGRLPPAAQDAAVAPDGPPRVIVATNVAETSITIPGVRAVIDAGLVRQAAFDPRRGLSTLHVVPISRAAADQRAGRAGRTGPGRCLRLWTEAEHRARPAHDEPEIRRIDLAEALLQVLACGAPDPSALPWLDPPEPQRLAEAIALLRALGATTAEGFALTADGRAMARLPAHPRIARFLVEAARRGVGERAATWAALAQERDLLAPGAAPPIDACRFDPGALRSDLVVRERLLERAGPETSRGARHEVEASRRQLVRLLDRLAPASGAAPDPGATARVGPDAAERRLLAALVRAFPDHLAVKRSADGLACAMAAHKRVELDPGSIVRAAGPIVALEVVEIGDGERVTTRLGLASELDADVLADAGLRAETVRRVRWSEPAGGVVAVEQRTLGPLVLDEVERPATPAEAEPVLVERIVRGDWRLPGWDEHVDAWIARVRLVARAFPERGLIAYDDDDRALLLHELVSGATRRKEVESRSVLAAAQGLLAWDERDLVERMAPERLDLPSGRRLRLVYREGEPPLGLARIQDLFGLRQTPRIAGGRVRVVLEILAPNQRPVQRTDDLAGFWSRLYPELRKELKRRYPRWDWREDPVGRAGEQESR